MKRYLLHMSYLGTNFRGMQKQPIVPTVQGAVESALLRYVQPPSLTEPILCVSSRTDAGVHALSTTAHVDLTHPRNRDYDMNQITRQMNNSFGSKGQELRIISCTEVDNDFHARHAAISRSYLYRFMVPKEIDQRNFPIVEFNRSYAIRHTPFDVERVKRATNLFLGVKDFRTFAGKLNTQRYTNSEIVYKRKLDYFVLEKGQPLMPEDPLTDKFDYWNFRCGAKSFLYNQVRRMVATLIALGIGRIDEREIRIMLEVPSRQTWNSKAVLVPAHGLYLCDVKYDSKDLKNKFNRYDEFEQSFRIKEERAQTS